MYKACRGRLSSVSGTGKELVGLEHILPQQIKFTLVFIYLFLAVPGLCCSARTFSRCGKRGPLSRCYTRVSHCVGFRCCRAQALEHMGSVVVAHGLVASRHVDLPRPGIKPVSRAFLGGLLTTEQSGKKK